MSNNMKTFFARFPGFVYNDRNQPELEFARLRTSKGWTPTSETHKEEYRQFLLALVAETGCLMHTFFVLNFPDFDYDSRASPRLELERLRVLKGWSTTGRKYKRTRALFNEAFNKEFISDLDHFFMSYPEFDYNPRNEPKSEFERLRKHKKWASEDLDKHRKRKFLRKEYRKAKEEFFDAFIGVFAAHFGLEESIKNWRYLCEVLGVIPIPATPEACETALTPIHVNIFDLLAYVQEKTPYQTFETVQELSEYSLEKSLVYPIDEARGNALKFLLRDILKYRDPEKEKKKGEEGEEGEGEEGKNGRKNRRRGKGKKNNKKNKEAEKDVKDVKDVKEGGEKDGEKKEDGVGDPKDKRDDSEN